MVGDVETRLAILRHIRRRLSSDPSCGKVLVRNELSAVLEELCECYCQEEEDEVLLEALAVVACVQRLPGLNRMVASQEALTRMIFVHVSNADPAVSSAAMKVIRGLAVTDEGRAAMRKMYVLQQFMFILVRIARLLRCRQRYNMDYFYDALTTAEMLITDSECSVYELPRPLVFLTCRCLQQLWQTQHKYDYPDKTCLPRFITRLAMLKLGLPSIRCARQCTLDVLVGPSKRFMKRYWEKAPTVHRRKPGSFHKYILLDDFPSLDPSKLLPAFCRGSVTCPAVDPDILDSETLIRCMGNELGAPLLYEQDVRLVKLTETGEEEHLRSSNRSVSATECLAAYKAGYTVAVRGMEFRASAVASVCDFLAWTLGQPTVGANLYITPANAQGLKLHYDDHCVFVVQLAGKKRWHVYPSTCTLPWLYAIRTAPQAGSSPVLSVQMQEGDVLYIPRGFPHQASTQMEAERCSKKPGTSRKRKREGAEGYSVHITFSVEVETPFSWEGFMHMAVHNAFRNAETEQSRVAEFLLHCSIRMLSIRTAALRKACLAAGSGVHAAAGASELAEAFSSFVEVIAQSAEFEEARDVVSESKDDYVWMNWMDNLPGAVTLRTPKISQLEAAAFYRSKSEFIASARGDQALFERTRESFRELFARYKDARTRHALGLLSLHHWVF